MFSLTTVFFALGWGLYNLPLSQTYFIPTQPQVGRSNNLSLPVPEFDVSDDLRERWRQNIKYQAVDLARKTDVFYQKYLRLRLLNSRRYRRMLNEQAVHIGIYTHFKPHNYTQTLKEHYVTITKFTVFLQTVQEGIPKIDELRLWHLMKKFINQTKKMLFNMESAMHLEDESIPHVVYEVDEIWRSFSRVADKYIRDVTLLKELRFFFKDMSNCY